jgi:hypothetical protein
MDAGGSSRLWFCTSRPSNMRAVNRIPLIEVANHWEPSLRNTSGLEFMLRNHVTLINDKVGCVPPEAMPQLEKLARLAGARFVLSEVANERSVNNVAVGKLHQPCSMRRARLPSPPTPKPIRATGFPANTTSPRRSPFP